MKYLSASNSEGLQTIKHWHEAVAKASPKEIVSHVLSGTAITPSASHEIPVIREIFFAGDENRNE